MSSLKSKVISTAVGLVVVSGGVLWPIHTKISTLEVDLEQLESQRGVDSSVSQRLDAINARLEEVQIRLGDREHRPCPDTPAAQNQFETDMLTQLDRAGLVRTSMDRRPGMQVGQVPCFVIELAVEGDAFQLHTFLRGLESIQWLTRVLSLEVNAGENLRRIKMQVAVLLETGS